MSEPPLFIRKEVPGAKLLVPRQDGDYLVVDEYVRSSFIEKDVWVFNKESRRTLNSDILEGFSEMRNDFLGLRSG